MKTVECVWKDAVDTIHALYNALYSLEWRHALAAESPSVQADGARLTADVQLSRLQAENAQLAQILTKLQADETLLAQGTADLQNALADMKKVDKVISTATKFLGIVAKIFSA